MTMTTTTVRVLVVDSSTRSRADIVRALEVDGDLTVVGQCDRAGALDAVRTLHPDVIALTSTKDGAATGTLNITGVTAAAGTILGVVGLGVISSNTTLAVTGASDNATGGSNAYALPAGAASGSFFSGQGRCAVCSSDRDCAVV